MELAQNADPIQQGPAMALRILQFPGAPGRAMPVLQVPRPSFEWQGLLTLVS